MYRLHIQAQWPLRFITLGGVIAYLRYRCPLWYEIEQWDGEKWCVLVRHAESKEAYARNNDPGEEDRT